MGKSKLARTRLQEEVDNLKASIEEGKAAITGLSQESRAVGLEILPVGVGQKKLPRNGFELKLPKILQNAITRTLICARN